MKTKCSKQPGCFPREEDHQYAPRFKIQPHPKDVWQNLENPLAHLKCAKHL
jgi:hypothetical protein